jgi:signal transduction histidine kinase
VIHLEHAATIDDHALAHSTLNQARSVLANVQLPRESDRHPLERLDEVVTAWSGIASITVHTPEQHADLNRWHLAVDAIEEAIANAIRHARAKQIQVSIQVDGEDLVVSVYDNGALNGRTKTVGIGQEWLTTVSAGQWHRQRIDEGSYLTLRLPGVR